MIKVKLCGLTRPCDIQTANTAKPDYIGFVFAEKSKRYAEPERARELKAELDGDIKAVGVFVNEAPEKVAWLLEEGIIHIAQLHGKEDEHYIASLRSLTKAPIIQAFRVDCDEDVLRACSSSADMILLDSGSGGTGTKFNWQFLEKVNRPYFLAGGLDPDSLKAGLTSLMEQNIPLPYGVDVSSGIETDGLKDSDKMLRMCSQRNEFCAGINRKE